MKAFLRLPPLSLAVSTLLAPADGTPQLLIGVEAGSG